MVMIPKSASALHSRLLETVQHASLTYFTKTDVGETLNRFSQDLDVIDFELPLALLQFSASTLIAMGQTVLISISATFFTVIVPFILALLYLLQRFYLCTSRQVRLMDLEAKAPLYSNFLETLNGLVTIRAFGWTSDLEKHNIRLLEASQQPFYLLLCIQRWLALVLDLTVAGIAVILMILVVKVREELKAGLVALALLNVMGFNLSLMQVIQYWTSLETSLGAIARIKCFVEDTASEDKIEETSSVPEDWPAYGNVTMAHVTAAYTTDILATLKDITINISAGQSLGICGYSGAGKSSFVALLLHMMEIQTGKVSIDGVDLSTIPREIVRQRLAVIPQEPYFLPGTVRENLVAFNQIPTLSNVRLEEVLGRVGLLSIINRAGGLDAKVDIENLLSHGQRQLFCLARTMLKPARILILDEATASVDVQTDELMQKIIREWFASCTIIAVAHRLTTIRDFDRIMVLDRGCAVEYGEPEELLRDESSRFKALWDS